MRLAWDTSATTVGRALFARSDSHACEPQPAW
jgi:hypothetical protein